MVKLKLEQFNVIFLLDSNPATKIVMLKRAPTKKFAPNLYTGIGGKIEAGETVIESAYRELKEETGLEGITLKQFTSYRVNNQTVLYYFWGIYPKVQLPDCNEGSLEWVEVDKILTKEIIPTTMKVCKQWLKDGVKL